MILVASIAFILCVAVKVTFDNSYNKYYEDLWSLGSLLLMGYSVHYLAGLYKRGLAPNIAHYGPFWINAAVFYYFTVDIFLFAFANLLLKEVSVETSMVAWGFHNLNNIIKNVMFAMGIYYLSKAKEKKEMVYHSVVNVRDPKLEEVQYAYQKLRNMNMTDLEIAKSILDGWQNNDAKEES
jgi:hypothetical protein